MVKSTTSSTGTRTNNTPRTGKGNSNLNKKRKSNDSSPNNNNNNNKHGHANKKNKSTWQRRDSKKPRISKAKSSSASISISSWKKISSSLPKFLDADSTVTAAKFGARRLPEMRSLWRTFMCSNANANTSTNININSGSMCTLLDGGVNRTDTSYYESGGCKASQRHLRRRTGSHNRKKRHRYPRSNIIMSSDSTSTSVTATFTTSMQSESRKARRKPSIMKQTHSFWKEESLSSHKSIHDDSERTSSVQQYLPSNWLETHLWHTKRFHMSPPLSIFGDWCIPLGHTNRGSRAALRLVKTKSTVQDATWTIGGRVLIIESSMQNTLINVLERICGGNKNHSALFLLNDNVLSGFEVGCGFIYDLEHTFPSSEIICPATFQFGRRENKGLYFTRIVVETPSIRDDVWSIVKQAVHELNEKKLKLDAKSNSVGCTVRDSALAILKVRGADATRAIVRSLQMQGKNNSECDDDDDDKACLDWGVLSQNNKVHTLINHGTIVPINGFVLSSNNDEKVDIVQEETKDKQWFEAYVNDIQKKSKSQKQMKMKMSNIQSSSMILISQCPNKIMDEKAMSMNASVSGWDIWCDPEVAKDLFLSLNNDGGSCSIGLIEASTFAMEACPPLPLWPRDYPDSKSGMKYWSSESYEWQLIRYCNEDGMHGGRIKTVMYRIIEQCKKATPNDKDNKELVSISQRWKHERISWRHLESDSTEDNHNETVIVIKGAFVVPFNQALSGWCPKELLQCKSTGGDNADSKRRRPRRKVAGSLLQSTTVPPLEKQMFEAQEKMCSMLLSSLSMSTLLRCHIIIDGKGTLSTGMIIASAEYQKEKQAGDILGFIVSGMFSQSRGYYHGVGFVSSKRFLLQLTKGENGSFVRYTEVKGNVCVALKVYLYNKSSDDFSVGFLKILSN